MISFAEIAKEAYSNALDKGWYERDASGNVIQRDFEEMVALFHSELSEAVEELRDPKSVLRPSGIYYPNISDDLISDPNTLPVLKGVVQKPEGVAVELADLIIRLGDSATSWGCADLVEKDVQYSQGHRMEVGSRTPIGQISYVHQHISRLFERLVIRSMTDKSFNDSTVSLEIAVAVVDTERLCARNKWDLERAIKLKLAYNRTRPPRHGGKLA